MKVAVPFLLVVLCCSLGTGNPLDKERREAQRVSYQYYQKGDAYDSSADESLNSAGQMEMFGVVYQGIVCLFTAVRSGPADKKEAAYKTLVKNGIRIVKTYAASCGKTVEEMFVNQDDYRMYQKLEEIERTGQYGNFDLVESTFGSVIGNMGKSMTVVLHDLGATVGNVLNAVTGILGTLGIGGDLLGGVLNTVTSLTGGVLDTVGGIVGGLTGGLLGGGGGGGGGGLLGGVTGGLLGGGGGGGGRGGGRGLLGGLLGR